jgi:hypothetical protein
MKMIVNFCWFFNLYLIDLYYLTFKSTPLTQSSVDFILYDLRYNSSVNDGQLFLDGLNGPATPSAAGIINRDYLINTRGWLINTN